MSKTKSAHPHGSRLKDFGKLLPAEEELRAAVARGKSYVISETRPQAPTGNNRIRPGFLRFLALGGDDKTPLHARGIQLTGAWIVDSDEKEKDKDSDLDLDLDGCTVKVPLILKLCHVPGTVKLEDARLKSVTLDGSRIGELKGDGARFDGDLNLRRHPFLQDPPGTPFEAHGEVRLLGATIGGDLSCRGGKFKNPSTKKKNKVALHCDGVKVTDDVFLNEHFKANGEVSLLGATIGGDLVCSGGMFQNASTKDENRNALSCDRFKVTGNVSLNDNFESNGEVSLMGADIGGNLECDGGRFRNKDHYPLSCDGINITGNAFFSGNFEADGEVCLLGATIGGDLACIGGRFACRRPAEDDNTRCATALDLEAATIHGALLFRQPVPAVEGSIDLTHAHVRVLVDDAASWPPETVQYAETGDNLSCHVILDGFTYERLGGAAPTDAKMRQEWLERQWPKHLAQDFQPQPFEQVIKVLRETGHGEEAKKIAIARKRYDLRNSFYRLKPWARRVHPGNCLMGLKYIKRDLSSFQEKEKEREREEDSEKICFSEKISNLVRGILLFIESWFRFLFIDVLIGYGHRVTRAFWVAVVVFILSTLVFYQAHEQGAMVPSNARVFIDDALRDACTDPDTKATWSACKEPPMDKEHTALRPAFYTLDVLLPFAPLGQESEWKPSQESFTLGILRTWEWETWPWFLLTVMWFNIGFGWVVGLLIAAVVSGAVKRD